MNKGKLTYSNFCQMSFVAFLAVLLTLAPCSVRNSIEQSLGIETTTVANKSKSAEVKASSCIWVDIQQDKNSTKTNYLGFDAVSSEEIPFTFSHLITTPKHFSLTSYIADAVNIPFYILYSNFKCHL